MALLTLKDIGKIYVSEGNVAVGIRGVNLSFEKGEFVAVTGKSGSGKSTLLNVISGMDSYEEGEMTVEGEPTSHYLQSDWEAYRQKYISFIFQDYNIIESFTVLQNVELALMHIPDKKERRKRALELLDRVGLSGHIRQKGSKLSGGQKQRTVIARALAKDSPIILADEPTGNLDSVTSKEIIALLREVSRDKLLIIVTHNFDEVAEYATRHIRIFDGAVESDHALREYQTPEEAPAPTAGDDAPSSVGHAEARRQEKKRQRRADFRNGMTLGAIIFRSKPRLSLFLCVLLALGTLGVFAITALFDFSTLFDDYNLFTPINGRVVVSKQTGETISDAELEELRSSTGAKEALHYDLYLDMWAGSNLYINDPAEGKFYWGVIPTYGENYGSDILGRYPEASDEVLLYLPISAQPIFGKTKLNYDTVYLYNRAMKLVGVKYFYDNTLDAKALYTAEGFRTATAINALLNDGNNSPDVSVEFGDTAQFYISVGNLYPVDDLKGDFCIAGGNFDKLPPADMANAELSLRVGYRLYHTAYADYNDKRYFTYTLDASQMTAEVPAYPISAEDGEIVFVKTSVLEEIGNEFLSGSYRQASLFYENEKAAKNGAEQLRDKGYIAVVTTTRENTYEPDPFETIIMMLAAAMMLVLWLLCLIFFAFFLNLCSGRAVGAFRNDVAIMRSMGIPTRSVRVGMYVRMFLALLPAFVLLAVTANVIFRVPALNEYFLFLYPWHYAVIVLGMILLTVRVTHKQIGRIFGTSVKKALKGGAAE